MNKLGNYQNVCFFFSNLKKINLLFLQFITLFSFNYYLYTIILETFHYVIFS